MTRSHSVNALTSNFSQAVQDFTSRAEIKLDLAGCKGTCSGTVIVSSTQSTLHSAKTEYPVTVINDILTLGGSTSSVDSMINRTVELLYPYRETSGLGKFSSLLGGIAYAAGSIYDSDIKLYNWGTLALQGDGPMMYTYKNSTDDALGTSNMTWADPTPFVLDAIREMTFRAAIAFSDPSYEQTIKGT